MSKRLDSREFDTFNPADVPLDSSHESTIIEATSESLNKNYLAELAFMEEMMEITVLASSNPHDENPVRAGNNGQFVFFPRTVSVKTKRKFVDSLIVKGHTIATPYVRTPEGDESRAIKMTNSQKYPFTVDRDDNPRGRVWLRQRLAEVI